MDLFSEEFTQKILFFNNETFKALVDTEHGITFRFYNDGTYFFKDEKDNVWTTVPNECVLNGKQIFPKEGTTITFGGKKSYNFVSEDEVIDKAYTYFDYFIIRKKIDITKSYSRFPYEGRFHNLYYKSFRPRVHDKIKIKYSYN